MRDYGAEEVRLPSTNLTEPAENLGLLESQFGFFFPISKWKMTELQPGAGFRAPDLERMRPGFRPAAPPSVARMLLV